MRSHGTHSNYSHGCRCEPCRLAHREYERNRKRIRTRFAYGLDDMPVHLVDATETRKHILFLQSRGIGLASLSRRTGIAESNLRRMAKGKQKRVAPQTESRILAIPAIKFMPGQFVDAAPYKEMIQDIKNRGYTTAQIAVMLGIKSERLVLNKTVRLWRGQQIKTLHQNICAATKKDHR